MPEKELQFENFLNDIDPSFTEMVTHLHNTLFGQCDVKLQAAKSGLVVSYSIKPTKRVVANFLCRKKGPVVRVYADNVSKYSDFLQTLPMEMQASIEKTSVCRRMIDPTKCNARCPMGYSFMLAGKPQQKCRYNCFLFPITASSTSHIQALLEHELQEAASRATLE